MGSSGKASKEKDIDRRGFLRKVLGVTAIAGIAGVLSNRILGNEVLPPAQAVDGSITTQTATTGYNSTANPVFQATNTGSGAGVQGIATAGTGVLGTTTTGTGVQGTASGAAGIAVSGLAGNAAAIPIVAQGTSGQTANLQEWRNSSGTALASISSSGNFIGPALPNNLFNTLNTPSTGITSTALMAGLGYRFTPKKSGAILFLMSFQAVLNGTAPADFFLQPIYGTGTAPAFGATPVGNTFGFSFITYIPVSGTGIAQAFFAVLAGLTLGTNYWFDVSIRSDNAATNVWMNSINVSIVEL